MRLACCGTNPRKPPVKPLSCLMLLTGLCERGDRRPRQSLSYCTIATPWAAYVDENLNDYGKQRESYRPFAIAVPAGCIDLL